MSSHVCLHTAYTCSPLIVSCSHSFTFVDSLLSAQTPIPCILCFPTYLLPLFFGFSLEDAELSSLPYI